MTSDSEIDEEGRVKIPPEIRRQLQLKAGDQVHMQVRDDAIILEKPTQPAEFLAEVERFHKEVKKVTKKPIPYEELFG